MLSGDILGKILSLELETGLDTGVEDSTEALIYQKLQSHFKEFFKYFEGILRVSDQLNTVVQDFKSECSQIEQVAVFLKKGAEQQTADIQKSLDLIDDFTKKINEMYVKSRDIISLAYDMEENNKSVHESVGHLVSNQQKNDEAVADILDVIKRLINKTQKIGEITNLINRISSETDLLGLNAKVEAVHAGAAGRGFSVVASEIQRLSRESKAASVNISETIESVTDEIRLLQNVAQKSQSIFSAQSDSVNEVSVAFEKNTTLISKYIEEQKSFSGSIEEIKEDEQRLVGSISSIFSSVKEVSATAHEITSLTYNQDSSISLLTKLEEDLAVDVSKIKKQNQNIRIVKDIVSKKRIAMVFDHENQFFVPTKKEALKAAAVYDYDVSFFAPKARGQEGAIEMAAILDHIISEQYDALVISPLDDVAISQKLRQLNNMGTKVVFINSKLNNIDYISYIQTNGIAAGAAAARTVISAMGNNGDVIVNTWSDVQISAIEDRKKGFIDEIRLKSNIKVHEVSVASQSSQAEADQKFDEILRRVPKAGFIYLTNCDWGLIFANYLKKNHSNIQVITIDFTQEIQQAMSAGLVHYAIGQRNYSWGGMSIDVVDKSFRNKPVKRYVDTGTYEANIQNMNIYKSFIE